MILGGAPRTLLEQSLCHTKSRFLNLTDTGDTEKNLHFWSLRLIYLAFHRLQHGPAVQEAKSRFASPGSCDGELQRHKIGKFDFECPATKFLVVTMGTPGLGAVLRLGAVNALIIGAATNRTVLFVNNSPTGPKFIREPWIHSSCDRRDSQCFFLPITPCVVTEKELEELHVLKRSEYRQLFAMGVLPEEHDNKRVIGVGFPLRPQRVPTTLHPNLLKLARSVIDDLRVKDGPDPYFEMLERAAELISNESDQLPPFKYFGATSKVNHAAVFYSMRPNPFNSKKIEKALTGIFPKDFNPDQALGLPIRASDKCITESECLSFDQYMKLMGQLRKKNEQLLQGTTDIVLTSESELILDAKNNFEKNLTKKSLVPFKYRFITNDGDVMQGTGDPRTYANRARQNVTADEIMLSAVTSLKTQLMARFSVGNCCSNFHNLIFDFLHDGCGAAKDNVVQCLQENEDAEFRVCCKWSKDEKCQKKKELKNENNSLPHD